VQYFITITITVVYANKEEQWKKLYGYVDKTLTILFVQFVQNKMRAACAAGKSWTDGLDIRTVEDDIWKYVTDPSIFLFIYKLRTQCHTIIAET